MCDKSSQYILTCSRVAHVFAVALQNPNRTTGDGRSYCLVITGQARQFFSGTKNREIMEDVLQRPTDPATPRSRPGTSCARTVGQNSYRVGQSSSVCMQLPLDTFFVCSSEVCEQIGAQTFCVSSEMAGFLVSLTGCLPSHADCPPPRMLAQAIIVVYYLYMYWVYPGSEYSIPVTL